MTKLRNKILLVLLTLCFVACMGILVACGDDDDKKPEAKPVTYTVTVKMDNAAVKGVKVTVKKGSVSFAPKPTGDDGKVEFSLAESSDYTVELANLPENYEVPADASLSFPSDRNLTVNLAEKFAYKVKLVNPDGTPFSMEGVTVGICTTNDTCRTPVAIDANGLARIETTKEDYHIQVLGLPLGYAYECDAKGYSMHLSKYGTYIDQGDENTYNSLSETVYEQTVTIYQVNVIDFAKLTELTPAEIAEYDDLTITGAKAYKVEATIPAESTVYYTFAPEFSGTYMLYAVDYEGSTTGYKINPRLLLGDTAAAERTFNPNGQAIDVTADKNYYINVTNKQESSQLELEFILTTPASSKDVVTGATTVNAVVGEGVNAVIVLDPTAAASYKLTVQGEGAIAKDFYSAEDAASYEFDAADYAENSECKVKFTKDVLGNPKYFAVSVKADSYPATITVKVEKIADLPDTVETITPTVTLTQFGEQTGMELVEIEMDGTSSGKIIYNETDKYYHYGTADGPLVVVMLTKALPADRFAAGAPLIYLELATNMQRAPYVFDVTTDADRESFEKGNTYKDYRTLLRGFTDYKETATTGVGGNRYTIPTDITVQSYYAKYVNSDGVYPLTKDLKDYLQYVVMDDMVDDNYVQWQIPMDAEYDDFWLFACYYYDTYIEPDVIVGEYNHVMAKVTEDEELFENQGDLTGGEYKLIINKRGTYTIIECGFFGDEKVEAGTWTKSDAGVYTFTTKNDADEDVVYSVMFSQEEGYVTLMTEASTGWAFRNENSEVVDVIVGEYKFVRCYDAEDDAETKVGDSYRNMFTGEIVTVTEDSYKLTINADGTFTIYELSNDEYSDSKIGTWQYKCGEYVFTVPDGDYDIDWNPIDLVFAVDYNIGTGALKLIGSDTSEWEFKKDGDAFVGLYELVSVTAVEENEDGESAPRTYNLGATYREVELAKDTFEFYVVGNTVEFTSKITSDDEFEGTWIKTNGGKYIILYNYYGYVLQYTARYNKINNTVTLVVDDAGGTVTYVFQKKANQTVDPLVGEYYATKKSDSGEETTVADGDFRSDDCKLVVKPSGKFVIYGYDYPDYVALDGDGTSGTWEKTEAGYAFTTAVFDFDTGEFVPALYATTVSNDLTEISLESEDLMLGWWFAKAELEAPVAPDAIVGEYKFVIKVNSEGEVEKAGDSYTNRFTGEEVNITADEYHLVVLKNGRYVILKLEYGQYVTETLGLWSKDGGKYSFYDPTNQDAATYGDLVYAAEYNEVLGRVVLTSESNGAWIFQKYAAESIEAVDEDENGIYTITVDDDDYTVYTFGSAYANLISENEDARLCMFSNGGIKFYYHSEGGDVLAAIAYSEGAEIGPILMEIVWKLDTVKSAAAVASMEPVEEGEEGEGRYIITVTVTAADDSQAVYKFDMTDSL